LRRDRSSETAAPLPSSGKAYRGLADGQRTGVAERCRDRVASRAHGVAARQLRAVSAVALRDQVDSTYYAVAEQRRPVAEVCDEVIAFVTPGLWVSFDGAKDQRDGTFTFETSSDKLLTISGRIDAAPAQARVVVRRELGRTPRMPSRSAPMDGSSSRACAYADRRKQLPASQHFCGGGSDWAFAGFRWVSPGFCLSIVTQMIPRPERTIRAPAGGPASTHGRNPVAGASVGPRWPAPAGGARASRPAVQTAL
jgi:hypothetical protein